MGSYQDIRNALPAASQVATVTEDFFSPDMARNRPGERKSYF